MFIISVVISVVRFGAAETMCSLPVAFFHVDDVSGIAAVYQKSPAFDFSSWGDSPPKKTFRDHWLVVSTPLKNMKVSIIPNIWKNIKCSKPPTVG